LEREKKAIEISKQRLDEAYEVDIEDFNRLPCNLKNRKFDIIIFADILEHLYDPFSVLSLYQSLLKPDGEIIISLPNVVIWDVRLKFLFGAFNYTDTGTCDRTHIRFFTLSSMRRLIKAARLKIIKEDFNPGIVRPFVPFIKRFMKGKANLESLQNPRAILDNPLYKQYIKYFLPLEKIICRIRKELFAFQFVFVAQK